MQGDYDQSCPEGADSGPAIEFPSEARAGEPPFEEETATMSANR